VTFFVDKVTTKMGFFLVYVALGSFHQADPNGLAVKGVGLRLLACWDCGFLSYGGMDVLCLVSFVCFSGRGICDSLITFPEESYRVWCV